MNRGFPLKVFKLDKAKSAMAFLFLQTIISFASEKFQKRENSEYRVVSIT